MRHLGNVSLVLGAAIITCLFGYGTRVGLAQIGPSCSPNSEEGPDMLV